MSLFNTRTLGVLRAASSGYVNGKWVRTNEPEFLITGTWQPSPGDVLEVSQDSKRSRKIFRGFTNTQIFPTDQEAEDPSDIIVVDGNNYEIIELNPWQNGVIDHYEFAATRILEEEV